MGQVNVTDRCVAAIKKALGRDPLPDEIAALRDALDERLEALRRETPDLPFEAAVLQAADDVAGEVDIAAQIERRNRMLNIMARERLTGFVRRAEQAGVPVDRALEAAMVGINTPLSGGRRSVDAVAKGRFRGWATGFLADLRRETGDDTLVGIVKSRELDRDIARALWEIDNPRRDIDGGDPSLEARQDIDPRARRIAKVMNKYQEAARIQQNEAGAFIRKMQGYIVRQSHEATRIRRLAKDPNERFRLWRDEILPRLDHARTFGDQDPEAFLKAAFDDILSGNHIATREAENEALFGFRGPSNLAKRISRERVLHFRDADAWYDYNQQFGQDTLIGAFIGGLDRAARNSALMETFGTNPRAMFDDLLKRLKDERQGDFDAQKRLDRQVLRWQFAEITGETRIPHNEMGAKISAVIRAVQAMAKLGGATLSAIADAPFVALELRHQGVNWLEAWQTPLSAVLRGRGKGEAREIADMIGVGMETFTGDIAARFLAMDDVPGAVARAQNVFFKLNLLSWWTDSHKTAAGLTMARNLARRRGTAWNDLPDRLRRQLEFQEIGEFEWALLRDLELRQADGRNYLTPDAVRQIPDDRVRQALGDSEASANAVRRFRQDLEDKLRSYYTDRVDFAVITPGARERAAPVFGIMGSRPGTLEGEFFRFMNQFKGFPVTVVTKAIGREVFTNTTPRERVVGMAHLMAMTTAFGYLAQSAKEIAKGREPRDPLDPFTWWAAFLQGGGAGIYGDFLLGETNRFGRSLLDTLAGPTIGTFADLDELRARAMAGDDTAARAWHILWSNMPGANLFYTRLALDMLFVNEVSEQLNPGYLRRLERRIAREQNQTFIIPPTEARLGELTQ